MGIRLFIAAAIVALFTAFGTITVGARADLLLLSADPRADIGAVARPIGIVLRGVWRPR